MASDHDIDILDSLIAAMTARLAFVHSISGETGARARQRRMLKQRILGLGAQITSLGGKSNVAVDDIDMEAGFVKALSLGKLEAADHAGAALAGTFRAALDDGHIAISTRAAINTAWLFLELNLPMRP